MDLDSFPDIEDFHKLPREVIVKGASSGFDEKEGMEIRGIVINNVGRAICDINIQVVVFDSRNIPIMSTHKSTDPDFLQQGGVANFIFHLPEVKESTDKFYLHANWRFDESE